MGGKHWLDDEGNIGGMMMYSEDLLRETHIF